MKLFPAIDLIDGCAVRLLRGDYEQKTVYSRRPLETARAFRDAGARFLHVVDLEGARDGGAPNLETVRALIDGSGLRVQVGGGIRDAETAARYLNAGAFRVILGTAAVTDPDFLERMVRAYGDRIAVGADIRDGMAAIRGWTELSALSCFDFCGRMQDMGVRTVICTDISRDGMLSGTNLDLYRALSARFSMDFIASGGVSSLEDVLTLRDMGMSGAILGKALYAGGLNLAEAIALCGEEGP